MKKITIISLLIGLVIIGLIRVSGQPSNKDYMKKELSKIEQYIAHKDSFDIGVSKVTVAWHLDHSLKVINGIYDTLNVSDPRAYKSNFNFARTFSYTFGFIPRGRAQSPKSVLPPDNVETKNIVLQLVEARKKIIDIESLDEKSNFYHPVFNQLNKKQSKRFIEIHTRHHLKIVEDILKL